MSDGEDKLAERQQQADGGESACQVRQEETNPRPWAIHNLAGVEALTRTDPYEFIIRFKEQPQISVLEPLKTAGFRWNREKQWWARPIIYSTRMQDRELGQRTYGEVVKLLLAEKGAAPPSLPPF